MTTNEQDHYAGRANYPADGANADRLLGEKPDPFRAMRLLAVIDAEELANRDLEHRDDPAFDVDIKNIAGNLAHTRLHQNPDIRRMIRESDASEIRKAFVTSFVAKYQEIIESEGMTILDGEEESLRERVRADKERDRDQNGDYLSNPVEIICRAAIEKYDPLCDLNKRSQPDYFSKIASYANKYLSLYTQTNLEENLEENLENKIKWEDRLKRAYLFRE